MAGISTEQGSDKLNTELNLVPFIDLLSTLTLFLLVTAVWLQVAAIPAAVKSKGRSSTAVSEQDRMVIHVTPTGYALTWPNGFSGPREIRKLSGGIYDHAKLSAVLLQFDKNQKIAQAAISADDIVGYGSVIEAIDSAKAGGLKNVALSP